MFIETTKLNTSPNTFSNFDEFIEFNKHFRAFVDTARLIESYIANGSVLSTTRTFNTTTNEVIRERTWISEEMFLTFKHSPERKALRAAWSSLGWQFEDMPTS